MSIDEKLDRLLVDVAVVSTQVANHTKELEAIQEKLEPVVLHVAGVKASVRTIVKISAGILGVLTCLITALTLFH